MACKGSLRVPFGTSRSFQHIGLSFVALTFLLHSVSGRQPLSMQQETRETANSGQQNDLVLSSAYTMQHEESIGLRSLLQNAPSLGDVKYTVTKGGGSGATPFGPDICPGKSFVRRISIYKDTTNRLTAIGLRCNDAANTYIYQRTDKGSNNDDPAQADSATGFNSVTGYAGGSGGRDDIVSALTFKATNGATASIGANVGFYGDKTQPVDFGVPSNAVIVGVGGRRGYYFDSVFFAYRQPA